jgi:hypothetical protein
LMKADTMFVSSNITEDRAFGLGQARASHRPKASAADERRIQGGHDDVPQRSLSETASTARLASEASP